MTQLCLLASDAFWDVSGIFVSAETGALLQSLGSNAPCPPDAGDPAKQARPQLQGE